MLITKSCPRCQGDLAYVSDVGDTYYSCVQCGHIVYRLTPVMVAAQNREREAVEAGLHEAPRPLPVSRDEVHRRRIRRRLQEQKKVA